MICFVSSKSAWGTNKVVVVVVVVITKLALYFWNSIDARKSLAFKKDSKKRDKATLQVTPA